MHFFKKLLSRGHPYLKASMFNLECNDSWANSPLLLAQNASGREGVQDWVYWRESVIPGLRRQRQEDHCKFSLRYISPHTQGKFHVHQGYIARPFLQKRERRRGRGRHRDTERETGGRGRGRHRERDGGGEREREKERGRKEKQAPIANEKL